MCAYLLMRTSLLYHVIGKMSIPLSLIMQLLFCRFIQADRLGISDSKVK